MPQYAAAWGQEEMMKQLEELIARVERGEQLCVALRLFKPDGTWEDVAVGGTDEEQARVLADLQAAQQRAN